MKTENGFFSMSKEHSAPADTAQRKGASLRLRNIFGGEKPFWMWGQGQESLPSRLTNWERVILPQWISTGLPAWRRGKILLSMKSKLEFLSGKAEYKQRKANSQSSPQILPKRPSGGIAQRPPPPGPAGPGGVVPHVFLPYFPRANSSMKTASVSTHS